MADSPALRSRRRDWHARGDHSLCRPEHCRAAKLAAGPAEPSPLPPGTTVAEAVEQVLAAVAFRNDHDPRLVHAAVARRCAREIDSATVGATGLRELSVHLAWLLDALGEDEDPVTVLQASAAAKLAGALLSGFGAN